jgi:hypothetical protein
MTLLCACLSPAPIVNELLGNSSVKTFPRQRTSVEGVVFCTVRVVLKERKVRVAWRSGFVSLSDESELNIS